MVGAVSAGLTFIAVVVALILGIRSIRETRDIQKREFRHRLLNVIADWAMELQTTEFEFDIPLVSDPDINKMGTVAEGNTLLRYAIVFGKTEYVRAIALGSFKGDLLPPVNETIRNFTAYLYLRSMVFGMDSKKAFGGTALKIIEEVDAELTESQKSIEDLKDEYARRLAGAATSLQIRTGDVMASLLNS
ncbi:MAG: hypothetical protein ISS55_08835 [Dehalococcoidales bacterium]|nr:hypothetical protein [Dehalococcoidales bacterium]